MLSMRPTQPESPERNDWFLLDGEDVVGRLYEDVMAQLPGSRWFWALTEGASGAHVAGIPASGREASLAKAKTAIWIAYNRRLEWAAQHRPDSDSTAR